MTALARRADVAPNPLFGGVALAAVVVIVGAAIPYILGAPLEVMVACALGPVMFTVAVLRPDWAAIFLVASFPLEWSFDTSSGGAWAYLTKGIGALALCAFAAHLVIYRARLRPDVALVPVLALAAAYLMATTSAQSLPMAMSTTVRLVSFVCAYIVITQALRRSQVRAVVVAFVTSTAAATILALVDYLRGVTFQARPVGADVNDFAFVLVIALVLAFWLVAVDTGWRRAVDVLLFAVVAAGLALSFSRGAVLGAVVAAVTYAIVLPGHRTTLRRVVGLGALAAGAGLVAGRQLVIESLARKGNVADDNVDSRLGAWGEALRLIADQPMLGIGPGNFGEHSHAISDTPAQAFSVAVVHNTMLDVAIDAGVIGLCAFLALLTIQIAKLIRFGSPDLGEFSLSGALIAAYLGAMSAALFSNQVFNGALWALLALPTVLTERRTL